MSLNPNTSNFNVSFSSAFFSKEIDEKYDDFLKHENSPIKDIASYILESIQSVSPPGFEYQEIVIQNVGAGNNKGQSYDLPMAGTANESQILDTQNLVVTFRNTILNWSRMNEFAEAYYARERTVTTFDITITFMDSSGLPIIVYYYTNCFISGIPGLLFSNTEEMNDSKTFDVRFSYGQIKRKVIIPQFKKTNVKI